ncbi:MAG: MBL fold metallo-hydrolase [Leptospiraceae bacterium]|nr:MBL fold metallo-hydrolase [Leptospiraceae bacterium]
MADKVKKLATNVQGNFFVDSTCIDCETCMWIAPNTFGEKEDQSHVHSQPETKEERILALRALFSCPTNSIGYLEKPEELTLVRNSFPIKIFDNVYHLGFHSEKSFGAASYFIQHEKGNIMIDSPRFYKPLAERLKELGGVKYLFLTHRDDVADHSLYHEFFGCDRIIHIDDSRNLKVERNISGKDIQKIYEDVFMIPTPGHTRGSVCLLYRNEFLFTGDHLAYSNYRKHLIGFRNACWYSWDELKVSMRRLYDYEFRFILPGHGFPYTTETVEEMKQAMKVCLDSL